MERGNRSAIRKSSSVLVINDTVMDRTSAVDRLYEAGVGQVEAPQSYHDLIKLLSRNPSQFALVVLDYNLENWGLHGVEAVLENLRIAPATARVPLVIVTAYPHDARAMGSLGKYETIDAIRIGVKGYERLVKKYIG